MELVIFIGLQASGKSTFYRQRLAASHVLVSKDCFPNATKPQIRQMKLLDAALAAGQSVVVDNTNPTQASRTPLIAAGRARAATVVGYYFESKVEERLSRNRARAGRSRVSDVAICSTIKVLERPSVKEGFDCLYHVRIAPDGRFDVTHWIEEDP